MQNKYKLLLVILLPIIFYCLGVFWGWEIPIGKTEKNQVKKDNNVLYSWTLTTNRVGFAKKLPDRFRVYTPANDLVFDSTKTKPFFSDGKDLAKSQIKTALSKNSDQTIFSETYTYLFAEAQFDFVLYPDQKYVDLKSTVKYTADKNVEFEGFQIDLSQKNPISYLDETYQIQKLTKPVLISQWTSHLIESKGLTITDNSAEVMALIKSPTENQAKFYNYYGKTRENVYRRDYANAAKAEPKIDLNLKHKTGDIVNLEIRADITTDQIPALAFRWPYAKDSVLTMTAHADLGGFLNAKNDAVNRLNAVFWGTSDKTDPNYGEQGIFAHHLRLTNTVFAVNNDNQKRWSYYGNLEDTNFLNTVTEIYRRGIDIGAHRLTDDGIGLAKDPTSKIALAFKLLNQFNSTVWIDHSNSGDCINTPERELLSGCGSLKNNPLYLMDYLSKDSWKYVWAGGQDSQNPNYKNDYQLNAFSTFLNASQILYSYQGASNGLIPEKLMMFASTFGRLSNQDKLYTATDLDQLAQAKGFNNSHTYLVNYGPEVIKGSKSKPNPNQPDPLATDTLIWTINSHLEDEFALLEKYQSQDKVWVRDFTTVADYLQAWKKVKVLDFTAQSVTIQNQAETNIDGLTLIIPNQKISAVSANGVYYPYIRNQYVVLPRLNAGEIRKIDFEFGDIRTDLPQITNFTDKQIAITDVSFNQTDKILKISINSTGKLGQDLVVDDADISIKIPNNQKPEVLRDGATYSNTTFTDQVLTIKTDTNQHNFEVKLK